jgi:3-hydroxy-9,10-secoandrosta-1,3,5(10)-triene-9,17-dione monooxygenase reductase component
MNLPDDVKQSIGKALGRVPSGVFILTAGQGEHETAMLASWVQQAGFDPPAVSIAVAKGRPVMDLLRSTPSFALSILGKDTTLMRKYARGIKPGESPFEGVAIQRSPNGSTYLSDAVAYLDCRLLHACDFGGDHEIIVAQVTGGRLLRDAPCFTHTRGNGFHY